MKLLRNLRPFCVILVTGALLPLAGCSPGDAGWQSQLEGYPIAAEVMTTRQRTVVPDAIPAGAEKIRPDEIAKFKQNGYGSWHYGPGLELVKRLDLMPTGYTGVGAAHAARLLNFFAMTDVHISDKESPAQAVLYGLAGGVSSGYSPIMLYTTHVLDAAVQTVNALHKQTAFDFGIALGDACNATQYNELRWYIDVLDGKDICPDSGVKDDPVPGPHNDYQDRYKAAGLDKAIPWYQALGNHDHFWLGFEPPNDYVRQTLIGEDIINLGNVFADPRALDSRGAYMGALDGSTLYGAVIGAGPTKDFTTPPKVRAADANRRSLAKAQWMAEFLKTSSTPVGHGFTQANIDQGFACYSFEPKSGMPLKVIVLDDTQRSDDATNPDSLGFGHGSLDSQRYAWLVKELDKGQAEGQLMIIAAHIPIGVEPPNSMAGWSPTAPLTEKELFAKLHEYPNLIAWIAGHRHLNTITAFKSPDAARPELGFWQIETSSLRDFPQQFRTFEIVRNSDNTVSILTTDVDPAVKDGSFAAISRTYGVAAQQMFKNPLALSPTGSCNAELVKQLSPEMQAQIQKCGAPLRK
jgi:metallophosphoesterase (TIGR03768 family)